MTWSMPERERPTVPRRRLLAATVLATFSALTALGVQLSAAPPPEVFVSQAVYSPATDAGNCSTAAAANQTARQAVDHLDDVWRASAAAQGLDTFTQSALATDDPVSSHPTTVQFSGSSLTAQVSLRNVDPQTVPWVNPGATGNPSTGALANVTTNGPRIYNQTAGATGFSRLQDCAPYPEQFNGEPAWHEVAGSQLTLNGVLFEFSEPVQAWGAWFGDLETRPTTPAWIKAFDSEGVVIFEGDIPADDAEAPWDDTICGDNSFACGNRGTRWVGLVSPDRPVAAVLVTVGDDDPCGVAGTACDAVNEKISWIGATIATNDDGNPNPTTTTTTTTTIPTTTTTTTTTTTATTLPVPPPPPTTATTLPGPPPPPTTASPEPSTTSTSTSIPQTTTSTSETTPTMPPSPPPSTIDSDVFPPGPTSPGPAELPATGYDVASSNLAAIAALLAGVGLVAASRSGARRDHTEDRPTAS